MRLDQISKRLVMILIKSADENAEIKVTMMMSESK